jgi:hypothetical protein
MDEVDGMAGNADRGGMGELVSKPFAAFLSSCTFSLLSTNTKWWSV